MSSSMMIWVVDIFAPIDTGSISIGTDDEDESMFIGVAWLADSRIYFLKRRAFLEIYDTGISLWGETESS